MYVLSHTTKMQQLHMQSAQGWDTALRHEKHFLKWLPHISAQLGFALESMVVQYRALLG